MTLKAVLYDLDGTLIDSYQLILKSHRHATSTVLGRVIPDERLMATVGKPLRVQFADYTDDPVVIEEMFDVYQEYNALIHDQELRGFDGVGEMLARFKEMGIAQGVVTSKLHKYADKGLRHCGYSEFMDVLIGPDDCDTSKPDPGPVLKGCELLGIDPGECMYVGDSPFDVRAGADAGCVSAAVLWGMFGREKLEEQNPDYVLEQVADLVQLVESLA